MEVVDRYTCSWVQVLCLEGLYLFLDCLPRRSGCRVSSLFSVLTRGAERSTGELARGTVEWDFNTDVLSLAVQVFSLKYLFGRTLPA